MADMDHPKNSLEKSAVLETVASSGQDDDDANAVLSARRRIRYEGDEEEHGGPSNPADTISPLKRRGSTYSVHSLSSVRSGRHIVDPSIILPVQYRTLSYDIANVKAIENAKNVQEKAAIGEPDLSSKVPFLDVLIMLLRCRKSRMASADSRGDLSSIEDFDQYWSFHCCRQRENS